MTSGTLYFDSTQYGAQYAVAYSYSGSIFYIDSVSVKLTQWNSVWWAFNLTVKIDSTTIANGSKNHFIDTWDWYDLGISGSANVSNDVTVTLTGSAIHENLQFNVASPTSQTVSIDDGYGDSGDIGGSDVTDPDAPEGEPTEYYLWVSNCAGADVSVERVGADDSNLSEGDYLGLLSNPTEIVDGETSWNTYRVWPNDSFTFTVNSLSGYSIGIVDVTGLQNDTAGNTWKFIVDEYDSDPKLRIEMVNNSGHKKKRAYIGINNVAREVKRGYIGIDGVARRIKAAYIGIGGIARPCWYRGDLTYFGTGTPLSSSRYNLSAANNSKYAVFAGGYGSSVVDAYNSSLTHLTPSKMDIKIMSPGASKIGNYVIFAGGKSGMYSTDATNYVVAYNTDLTQFSPALLSDSKYNHASTFNNSYALFAGGNTSSTRYSSTVDAYDSNLTKTMAPNMGKKKESMCGGNVGKYAVFCGGVGSGSGVGSYAYDDSLTLQQIDDLSVARLMPVAVNAGRYLLFTGGNININTSTTLSETSAVDSYDEQLTRHDVTPLTQAKHYHGATSVNGTAIVAGGCYSNEEATAVVNTYDPSLTLSTFSELSSARYYIAASTIGDYAIFAGGYSYDGDSENTFKKTDVFVMN